MDESPANSKRSEERLRAAQADFDEKIMERGHKLARTPSLVLYESRTARTEGKKRKGRIPMGHLINERFRNKYPDHVVAGTALMLENLKRHIERLDETTRTLHIGDFDKYAFPIVRAVFPNPEGLLRPGMNTRVRIIYEVAENALLIPQKAVTELLGKQFATVVGAGDKVEQRPISTGVRVGDQWIVTAGLKAGERIVVEGLQKAPTPWRPGRTRSGTRSRRATGGAGAARETGAAGGTARTATAPGPATAARTPRAPMRREDPGWPLAQAARPGRRPP